jgi:hypothetical protein
VVDHTTIRTGVDDDHEARRDRLGAPAPPVVVVSELFQGPDGLHPGHLIPVGVVANLTKRGGVARAVDAEQGLLLGRAVGAHVRALQTFPQSVGAADPGMLRRELEVILLLEQIADRRFELRPDCAPVVRFRHYSSATPRWPGARRRSKTRRWRPARTLSAAVRAAPARLRLAWQPPPSRRLCTRQIGKLPSHRRRDSASTERPRAQQIAQWHRSRFIAYPRFLTSRIRWRFSGVNFPSSSSSCLVKP